MKRIYPISSAQCCQIRVIRYHLRNSPMRRLFFVPSGHGALIKKPLGCTDFVKNLPLAKINLPMDDQV
jgi:hypothetical protein